MCVEGPTVHKEETTGHAEPQRVRRGAENRD